MSSYIQDYITLHIGFRGTKKLCGYSYIQPRTEVSYIGYDIGLSDDGKVYAIFYQTRTSSISYCTATLSLFGNDVEIHDFEEVENVDESTLTLMSNSNILNLYNLQQ